MLTSIQLQAKEVKERGAYAEDGGLFQDGECEEESQGGQDSRGRNREQSVSYVHIWKK